MIQQIAAFGGVIHAEVNSAHGVFRKMRVHDPIDMFPMLDCNLGLRSGEVSSPVVIRIFPSQTNQLMARHIQQLTLPDVSSYQALQSAKEFLKKGGYDTRVTETEVKTKNVTETFYSAWQDSFDVPEATSEPAPRMPSAPSGPAPSSRVHTTTRAALQEEVTVYQLAPLKCVLRVKSNDATSETSTSTRWKSTLRVISAT